MDNGFWKVSIVSSLVGGFFAVLILFLSGFASAFAFAFIWSLAITLDLQRAGKLD